ncbi:MAG TPA: hypothetical protein VFN56_01765 [Candidatus Saccharimonadales bacterium]|nr:hypothetical protein [Candidatus Saccharimonadales bacterium]
MRKALFQIGLPLLALGVVRLIDPHLLFKFAGLDSSFAVIGISIALAVFTVTGPLSRWLDFRSILALGSIACFVLLIIMLNSPTLLGLRATYLSVLDMFVVFESSLLFALGALQPKTETMSVFTAIAILGEVLLAKLKARRTASGPVFGHSLNAPHFNS